MIRFLLIFFIILSNCGVQAQNENLIFPTNAHLPHKFKKTVKLKIERYNELFRGDSLTKNYSTPFILDKIDNDSNYRYLFLAEYWIAFHYNEIIPDLIKRITEKREVGLINSADLIIWERIENKQMEFYGHGGFCDDDLFTVAGRVNRLLREITGEDFGYVSMYSTKDQLEELQRKWIRWLKRLS